MAPQTAVLDPGMATFGGARRAERRYPVETNFTYQWIDYGRTTRTGRGRTINMSSSGILIATETPLPNGMEIDLYLDWPAKLQQAVALTLYLRGRTLRTTGNYTALIIRRHEFRTRRQAKDAPCALHASLG